MKLVSVVGARPQFVKAAVVSRAIRAAGRIREVVVHTGQHYDANMSEVFFAELGIAPPDYHLGIGSASHGAQTGRMLEAIEKVLLESAPDWVLVYGDTNSTLAGALAAAKLHVPVAHVEAGLRSFNRRMPEEINRVLTDHLAELLFAPTEVAVENLRREAVAAERIRLVGDVMYDAARHFGARAEAVSDVLPRLGLTSGEYVLVTIHRAENTDDRARLDVILGGLGQVAETTPVVFPVHPRTRAVLKRQRPAAPQPAHLLLTEPVGYLDMLQLEKNACLVVTDSGGVQKEAFFFEKPCVTLREETEWVELVELGWNQVVPPRDPDQVAHAIRSRIGSRGIAAAPYGDGTASQQIAALLQGRDGVP